ncbi:AAA family ATPase [Ruminiclostridium cellobioparum]|uniref:AAA family ATPase n=1 Tax=Ruminiclostridium cellobioparum TaxID=29355 RepID=UPI0028AF2FE1|nr:AAA family ATPase [Ruminiclostridium cellobioparum]
MIRHIHILGASGSGTTTLGCALEKELGYRHFDTDSYFWLPSWPPFKNIRPAEDRRKILEQDIHTADKWVLSGSLCGWGDVFIPSFELVVFLWLPGDIRLSRLIERERQRYGKEALEAGGEMYEASKAFIQWASRYDDGGMEIRSKTLHKALLGGLSCPVLSLEGDLSVEERVSAVKELLY